MPIESNFIHITSGLLPGIDFKIELGCLVVFFITDSADTHVVQKHIRRIAESLQSFNVINRDGYTDLRLDFDNGGERRSELRRFREKAVESKKIAFLIYPLSQSTMKPHSWVEQESDISFYVMPGVDGYILQRGKCRRAGTEQDGHLKTLFVPKD